MLTELRVSRGFSPLRDESGDDELSVLPRHTKVIVTGNNRTKSVLVGLKGVVKKAVGFGGWHWLVLKNGVEVKLQRNALSVLEPPTGNEEDDDFDFDDSSSGSDISEASNAQFSKLGKPRVRYAKAWGTSELMSQRNLNDFQSNNRASQLKVNLGRLGNESLWRYIRSYNLGSISPDSTKDQLVNAVQKHFSSQQLDEVQVIVEFIRAAKRLKTGQCTLKIEPGE